MPCAHCAHGLGNEKDMSRHVHTAHMAWAMPRHVHTAQMACTSLLMFGTHSEAADIDKRDFGTISALSGIFFSI